MIVEIVGFGERAGRGACILLKRRARGGRQPAQRRMRADMVVVVPPELQTAPCIGERLEDLLVEMA